MQYRDVHARVCPFVGGIHSAMNDLSPVTPFQPTATPVILPSPDLAWIEDRRAPTAAQVGSFLDHVGEFLHQPETVPAIWNTLFAGLRQMQRCATQADWYATARAHPIARAIWEDPGTAWAAAAPRGYHGDAHLIDFIYEHDSVARELAAASVLGRAVNAMMVSSAAAVAVQERRRLLARWMDAAAARSAQAEVLVLASGHLRELELAQSADRLARIVALDQDAASVAEMKRSYAHLDAIFPVIASIGRIIVKPLVHGRFDLAYAAGLFDYLDDQTAKRLLAGMFTALKPGGRLLFANFCHDVLDYGFMDAFMDWRLITRDEPEMRDLLSALPAGDVANAYVFRGVNRAVVYAVAEKRGA